MTVVQALTELTNAAGYRLRTQLNSLEGIIVHEGRDRDLDTLDMRGIRAAMRALESAWEEYDANRTALGEAVKAQRRVDGVALDRRRK